MEIDEEEVQLVEEGMKEGSLDEKKNETKVSDEPEPATRIVKNWKRPEGRIPVVRDPTKFAVSPIAGELIPINEIAEHMRISLIDPKYREQKEKMMAKIRETTLAHDDEISSDIVGPARTRPDIFGTQGEEDSNPMKAEIEKLKEEQPKQVIWYGHTRSIGPTANQAMSQSLPGEELSDFANNNEARNLPGPTPPPNAGIPSIRPLPLAPGLAPNISWPPGALQCSIPTGTGVLNAPQPRMPVMPMIPLNIPVSNADIINSTLLPPVVGPPMRPPVAITIPTEPVSPPPGSPTLARNSAICTDAHASACYVRSSPMNHLASVSQENPPRP